MFLLIFSDNLTIKGQIELLERSILVNSYAYYMLDRNILEDYQYDANTRQLLNLRKNYPDEFKNSRYYEYFNDFESGTGYDLVFRIKKDNKLESIIHRDAVFALNIKNERR